MCVYVLAMYTLCTARSVSSVMRDASIRCVWWGRQARSTFSTSPAPFAPQTGRPLFCLLLLVTLRLPSLLTRPPSLRTYPPWLLLRARYYYDHTTAAPPPPPSFPLAPPSRSPSQPPPSNPRPTLDARPPNVILPQPPASPESHDPRPSVPSPRLLADDAVNVMRRRSSRSSRPSADSATTGR